MRRGTHIRKPVEARGGCADGQIVDAVEVRVEDAGGGPQALERACALCQRREVQRKGLWHWRSRDRGLSAPQMSREVPSVANVEGARLRQLLSCGAEARVPGRGCDKVDLAVAVKVAAGERRARILKRNDARQHETRLQLDGRGGARSARSWRSRAMGSACSRNALGRVKECRRSSDGARARGRKTAQQGASAGALEHAQKQCGHGLGLRVAIPVRCPAGG